MNSLKIKKNDTVVVLSGKDKGKQGKVLGTVPSEGKVVVEGINMVTCHIKPRTSGRGGRHRQARGRYLCQQGPGGLPQVRQDHPRGLRDLKDGKKVRVCKKCGAEL